MVSDLSKLDDLDIIFELHDELFEKRPEDYAKAEMEWNRRKEPEPTKVIAGPQLGLFDQSTP